MTSMSKPFAAFDVDGTIFKSSLAEVVIEEGVRSGVFDEVAFAPARAYRKRWQTNNSEEVYQEYLNHLVGAFISQMAGVEVAAFDNIARRVLDRHSVRRFGFPRRLIQALGPSHHTLAISGSPEMLVRPFLDSLHLDEIHGAQFEVIDGRFTGVATPVGDKAAVIHGLTQAGVVHSAGSVALGDTISDESMLAIANYPVMFNASLTLTNAGKPMHWARVNEVKDQVTVMVFDPEYGNYVECLEKEFMATLVA